MAYNVLIVDDERLSRSYIRNLTMGCLADAAIYEADSAEKALEILAEQPIDILFLDIKMPGANGFDFLAMAPHRNFELIFVTAHSEYAINAIRENACDYLLKPIKQTEFQECLQKVTKRLKDLQPLARGQQPANDNYLENKLSINHQQGVKFIYLKDLVYLEAKNTYTTLHLVNDTRITVAKSISLFEAKLDSGYFFRIHRSSIINIFHCREFISYDGGMVVMSDGSRLHISKNKQNELLDIMTAKSGALKI